MAFSGEIEGERERGADRSENEDASGIPNFRKIHTRYMYLLREFHACADILAPFLSSIHV